MKTWGRSWFCRLAAVLSALLAGCDLSLLGILPDPTDLLNVDTQSAASDNLSGFDASAPIPDDDCLGLGEPEDATHQALLEALNDFRAANGLPPLVYSRRLEAAADAQVRDLYERDFFAHINPDGEPPGLRALDAGFCHEYVGENLAAGQKTVEAAQQAWENSPPHRQNMLEPHYRYVGVGVYQDPTGRMYWAQEMAYDLP
ncbi:MAG: CAP domain-containing protein [Planctomycetes bacterium]|nr:CAP domain-containing protein [Planctomycetota bacterium]